MRWLVAGIAACSVGTAAAQDVVRFRTQEIEQKLGVGYAVVAADVDHDGKTDIVVVDTTRVLWYRNPDWKPRLMLQGATKPDNVCIAAHDIDGDGKVDFALGADWKPFNTQSGGTLQWLKRGKSLDEPWTVYPIDTEPTVHRIRFIDIDGTGKPALVSVPLMGRGATKEKNWMDGRPVRVTAYRIPADPAKDRWPADVLDESLHVVHNFAPIALPMTKRQGIIAASYQGVTRIVPGDAKWRAERIGAGNQDNPKSNLGASEIKQGTLKSGRKFIATVEPWHGNQVVVYAEPTAAGQTMWDRFVIDDELKWGHAVSVADLDGDGGDELVIGVRDDGGKVRRGVRVYKSLDERGSRWTRQIVDDGGVAVEDLAIADFDGDGRPDLIAVGRQTHNARIYWNLGR